VPTIFEPFRIKVVEPIPLLSAEERRARLSAAGFNLFGVRAEHITFDLLTDSGASAMSAAQWAALIEGDESYAGSRSFFELEAVVRDLTGFKHVIPTHQGRAAERILFALTVKAGSVIPSNAHFDTTRANIEFDGGIALDLVIAEGRDPAALHPFKGNVDLDRLESCCKEHAGTIPLGLLTLTNNTGGGQPVSLANVRAAADVLHAHGIPLFLDACRIAENGWFVREREPGQAGRRVKEIVRELYSFADGCTFSAKKDGLVNIGGFLAMNDDDLAERARQLLILTEGFPTYGGMAGRDLSAMAVGLLEALDERYLEYRIASARYLATGLNRAGIPTVQPPGGHAVYIDAKAFLPHIPPERFPGQSLACELYLQGGIRSCEIGSAMLGKTDAQGRFVPAAMDLVRLALPRRVYTQSHVDRILEIAAEVAARREALPGYRMTWAPRFLRHFTARFEPLAG
jgi:tyrosine phenol-lyase